MINAIFYPIFIHSNGTSNMTGQSIVCVWLAFMVLGVFLLVGSFIYAIIKVKQRHYYGHLTWNNIKDVWSGTVCCFVGLVCVIVPIVLVLFVLLTYYIEQILF